MVAESNVPDLETRVGERVFRNKFANLYCCGLSDHDVRGNPFKALMRGSVHFLASAFRVTGKTFHHMSVAQSSRLLHRDIGPEALRNARHNGLFRFDWPIALMCCFVRSCLSMSQAFRNLIGQVTSVTLRRFVFDVAEVSLLKGLPGSNRATSVKPDGRPSFRKRLSVSTRKNNEVIRRRGAAAGLRGDDLSLASGDFHV